MGSEWTEPDGAGPTRVDPLLDALVRDIDRLASEEGWRLDDDALVGRLDELPVLAERLRGIHLRVIGEISGRGTIEREQGWSIADRLATTLRQPISQARATALLAQDVDRVDQACHSGGDDDRIDQVEPVEADNTRDADNPDDAGNHDDTHGSDGLDHDGVGHLGLLGGVIAGRVSRAQARAICHVIKELPDEATSEDRGQLRDALIGQCANLEPRALRHLGNDLIERLFPEQVDAKLADQMEREHQRAQRRRFLDFPTRVTGGTVDFHGRLPFLQADRFRRLLDAYLEADRKAGPSLAADALLDPDRAERPPSKSQRRADALCHMMDDLDQRSCAPDAGGDRPTTVILINWADLLTGLRGAELLGTDQTVDPGTARQMACSGNVLPVILDGEAVPLDVGRTQRLFTGSLRRAIIVRDKGCAFPGCDVPPERCEVHHVTPWWLGGETSLHGGVLLCPHHHHLVEPNPRVDQATRWAIRLDDRALPEVIPPYRVDPLRRPRQHYRYRPLHHARRARQTELPGLVGAGPPGQPSG